MELKRWLQQKDITIQTVHKLKKIYSNKWSKLERSQKRKRQNYNQKKQTYKRKDTENLYNNINKFNPVVI